MKNYEFDLTYETKNSEFEATYGEGVFFSQESWEITNEDSKIENIQNTIKNLHIKTEVIEPFHSHFRVNKDSYILEKYIDNILFPTPETINCVIAHLSHIDQFPYDESHSAKLPCIFSWIDASTIFSSEYTQFVQSYIRNSYKNFRKDLKCVVLVGTSPDTMKNVSSLRREFPGRLLFHYIGFGFPNITKEGIWCYDRRYSTFTTFSYSNLLSNLATPSFFIFDCNHASLALEQISNIISKTDQSQDWYCICATGQDEELPTDPRLPKDFLTSILFSPLKMAVICHLLRYYHINTTSPKFALEPPFQQIWNPKSTEYHKNMLFLKSITDSIAADSLPQELYLKLFQGNNMTSDIFHRYLFAQFILKYYHIIPHSHPELPNLSTRDLWRRWIITFDSMIINASTPPLFYINEFYTRVSDSFRILLNSNNLNFITPYFPVLLYYMTLFNDENELPYEMLYEYTLRSNSKNMIVIDSIFPNLFEKLVKTDPNTKIFYPLCFLSSYFLCYCPSIKNNVDVDVFIFPEHIFNHKFSNETRILIAIVIASAVTYNERLQEICSSQSYMDSIKEEIAMSTPQLSAWMLMIVQRTFSLLYSPDSECFAKNGFHIQCAICLRSKCIELRAAAIATLSCFMRPFESNVNSQLLLMAIIGNISDVSFLVRFCLLLLVKKFVLSFDQLDLYEFNFNEKSYKEINKKLFGSEELKNNFEVIDNIMENMNFTDVTCEVSFYLLHFFSKDPHCSIRKVSNEMIKFLNIEKSSNEEYFEFSEEQEINEFLDNLNQNEALYRIMLYNTIENLKIKESETKHHYLLVENSFKIKNKINFIRFDNKNNGIAFSDNKTIYYLLQNEIYKHEFQTRIQNIQIISIDDRNYVTVLASDGCVYVWDPLINTFYITFRFNPKPNENKLNFICSTDSTGFYTISNNDVIAQWNLKSEQLLNEYELNIESEILYVEKTNDKIYMSLTNGDIFVFCIINKKYEIINHNLPIHKMIHINNFLYCLNSENQIELFYIGKWENILDNVFSFDVINNDKLLVCQINKAPFICNKSGNVLYEFTGVPSNCICACGEKGNFAAFGCDDGTLKITEIKK